MTFWRQLGLSDAAAAVLAVLALIFGGAVWLVQQGGVTEPVAIVAEVTPEPETVETIKEPEPEVPTKDAPKTTEAAPEQEVSPEPEVEPEPETQEPVTTAPKLDLVRVSAEGDAVIAGKADPGAQIVFLVNGVEMARATADGSGSFVGLFDIPASDTPNAVTVAAEGANGALVSDDSVLIAAVQPPVPEQPVIAEAEPVADAEPATTMDEPTLAEADTTPEADVTVATDTEAAPKDDAPVVAEVEPAPQADTPIAMDETVAANEPAQPAETDTAQPEIDIATPMPAPKEPGVEPAVDPVTEPSSDIVTADAGSEADPEPVIETAQAAEPVVDETPVQVQDDVANLPEVAEEVAPVQKPAEVAQNNSTPDVPTIVVAGSSGVTVVQPAQQPRAPTAEATANVVIDTITYDSAGDVALVGRGSGDGFVRVYLNDKPILTVPVDPDGSWDAPLADVDAGVYRLRIDEIAADGNVTSRVETPFQREEVELAADAPPTAVTVQPGSTLWAIAQDRFGAGIEYVRVYEANRDLIRDPDLIYPGQVFAIPSE